MFLIFYLILLSRTGDTGHPYIPDLSGNALHVSLLCMILSLGCDRVYRVKGASTYLYFIDIFKIKNVW